MSRADHQFCGDSQCRRCGLADRHPRCPPGFWMTGYELATWQYLPPEARGAYEDATLSNSDVRGPSNE